MTPMAPFWNFKLAAALSSASIRSSVTAKGFSQRMCFLDRAAFWAVSRCAPLGVAMVTISKPGCARNCFYMRQVDPENDLP